MSLRNQRGFSLIELAVVLVIAGIVLAITTPSINRFLLQARLRDSVSRVSSEIRLARQKAVTNSSRVWFWAGTGTNNYWIGEQRWTGANPDSSIAFAATQWKGPYALPSTVRLVSPNFGGVNYFWYTPKGVPNASGSVKLISVVGVPETTTVNVDLSGSVWK